MPQQRVAGSASLTYKTPKGIPISKLSADLIVLKYLHWPTSCNKIEGFGPTENPNTQLFKYTKKNYENLSHSPAELKRIK